MCKARCAGIQIANNPKVVIVAMTAAKTNGSRGVAKYTICANIWLATTPRSKPAAEPESNSMSGRLNAVRAR